MFILKILLLRFSQQGSLKRTIAVYGQAGGQWVKLGVEYY